MPSVLEYFDFEGTLVAAAEEAAKEATKEELKDAIGKSAGVVARSALIGSANVIAGALVGVALKTLLKSVDSTAAKLDKLVRKDFVTGMRLARQFLDMECCSKGDFRERDYKLREASHLLDSAYTLASDASRERFCIRLHQGAIACSMSQPSIAVARAYFKDCIDLIKSSYNETYAEDYASISKIVALSLPARGFDTPVCTLITKPSACDGRSWSKFVALREQQQRYQQIIDLLKLKGPTGTFRKSA